MSFEQVCAVDVDVSALLKEVGAPDNDYLREYMTEVAGFALESSPEDVQEFLRQLRARMERDRVLLTVVEKVRADVVDVTVH